MASARRARHARTALGWALLLFLLSQVALGAYISCRRPDLADPDFGPRLLLARQLLARAPGRPLVLVLGSSRAANGIATDMLPPPSADTTTAPVFFNMAMHAAGPFRELLTLRRLLHAGIRPQAVVIEVLPALLYTDGNTIQNPGYLEPGTIYRTDLPACRRYIGGNALHYRREWLLYSSCPAYANRVLELQDTAPDWLPPDVTAALEENKLPLSASGWEPRILRGPLNRKLALEITEEAYAPLLKFNAVNPVTDRVMHELLELCRRERMEVTALLAMPEGPFFRRMYAPETQRMVTAYLTSLAAEYDTRFVDAREWIGEEENFVDSHHLLPEGAELFTAMLWERVLAPYSAAPELPQPMTVATRR